MLADDTEPRLEAAKWEAFVANLSSAGHGHSGPKSAINRSAGCARAALTAVMCIALALSAYSIQHVPTKELPMPKKEVVQLEVAASNPNLSPATRFGNMVFVSGQTGRDPVTGEPGKDIREQTRNVLERIKIVLHAAGTSLDNVLSATTYLTDRNNLSAYNEEYATYFPNNRPARTTVTVAALNSPELLIEITVTACIPD